MIPSSPKLTEVERSMEREVFKSLKAAERKFDHVRRAAFAFVDVEVAGIEHLPRYLYMVEVVTGDLQQILAELAEKAKRLNASFHKDEAA